MVDGEPVPTACKRLRLVKVIPRGMRVPFTEAYVTALANFNMRQDSDRVLVCTLKFAIINAGTAVP